MQGCNSSSMDGSPLIEGRLFSMKNEIVVGIDVSKDFSYFSMIGPDDKQIGKQFKVNHNLDDLKDVAKKMKEVETRLKSQCVLVMESTGHYSSILFNFFHKTNFKVCMVNPIQTNSIKNTKVRKVKNDKIDAFRIAVLYRLGELTPFQPAREDLAKINVLCRQYFRLTDDSIMYKNHLIALVNQIFPGYEGIFSNITSLSSLFILENYSSPNKLLNAKRDSVVAELARLGRRGLDWANSKFDKLISIAKTALELGSAPATAEIALKSDLVILKTFYEQLEQIKTEISNLSRNIEEIQLVMSVTGIGLVSAATFVSEIRDFKNFSSSRKLVAFCGIDPAVVESGYFKGTRIKISKRGSSYLRRILFLGALACIRKNNRGEFVNPVLANYYNEKIKSKPKKVAIIAIMHKLVNYIFAVLRDKKLFEIKSPENHNELYALKKLQNAA